MGMESDDIDIALDDMFGEEFANMIREKQYENDVASGKIKPNDDKKSKGYGVIKGNSEKSKHLETAVIKVNGVFIDLVNLRNEEYAADSRVPVIKIGTPIEDAQRRDFNFNSIFYNINTQEIEDLTGCGLDDLQKGVVRTPLEPVQTFVDDPLRVLRSVRFANRFGFQITPEIYKAALLPEVREAFANKITYERITKEMDKIFEKRNCCIAVQQMYEYGILSLCIKPPQQIPEL